MKSYHSVEKQKKMSLEECLELGRRCSEGDLEARETLILSHMYLVDDVLFPFLNKGVDTNDLFQEGCLGLLKAVDLYNYKRGVLFSTYAVHWIKKQMRLALQNQNTNRPAILKDDEFWLLIKVRSVITRWMQKFSCEPTNEEIAKQLNISKEKVTKLLKVSQPFIKIDDPSITNNPSLKNISAEDEFFNNYLFLDDIPLTKREKEVLLRHLGFTKIRREETLEEIAASMHLSYETIRLDYNAAKIKVEQKYLNHADNI